ncbi:MAG: hypothetical protein Q4A36_00070 [Candidatus Saccharibacteria bacterium]|nr:hypothetical protein [Candidatus Saccharibacteria bacterium]
MEPNNQEPTSQTEDNSKTLEETSESQPEVAPQVKPESETETEPKSEHQSVPQPESKPESEPKPAPQPEPEESKPTPVPQSEPTPQKPAKKPKGLIALVIIFALLAAAGIGFGIWGVIITIQKPTTPEQPTSQTTDEPTEPTKPSNPEPIVTETEITDAYVLRDLDSKLATLHFTENTNSTIILGPSLFLEGGLYSEDGVSELYKISVINAQLNDHKNLYRSPNQEELASLMTNLSGKIPKFAIPDSSSNSGWEVVDANTFIAKYLEVFGNEPNLRIVNDETSKCPLLRYDSITNLLYQYPGCGGTSPLERYYYKNRYTADSDNAYVYINAGIVDLDTLKIYCEINTSSPCGDYNGGDFTIDASNHNKFAEYRFVFKKADNGTYYFDKVEKVSA